MSKSAPIKPDRGASHVRESERCLRLGNLAAAETAATLALALAPGNADALLALARVQRAQNAFHAARETLEAALTGNPGDATIKRELALVLAAQGQRDAAIALLSDPPPFDAEGWFALGCQYDGDGDALGALAAARSALAIDVRHSGAAFLVARSHVALGAVDAAAAVYRQLTHNPGVAARAWFALLDLKTIALDAEELRRLQQLHAKTTLDDNDRALVAFALGHALEKACNPLEAFRAFETGSRLKHLRSSWNPKAFSALVDDTLRAFDDVIPAASTQGQHVVFLVGMPRSGSTLAEQVLATHSDVVGASELNDLPQVIAAESKRRRQPFPQWASVASNADWLRLGEEYLSRTQRFQSRLRFTDKFPENWLYVGAIARMLPGAKVLFCTRDAMETLWSCYKQMFAPGFLEWSYDFESLARYAADCARLSHHFAERQPGRCRVLSHEALLADLEGEVRATLAFIGLDFDPACLTFTGRGGETRTASAAQVRQPLRQVTPRGHLYGELLAPLHEAMERVARERR